MQESKWTLALFNDDLVTTSCGREVVHVTSFSCTQKFPTEGKFIKNHIWISTNGMQKNGRVHQIRIDVWTENGFRESSATTTRQFCIGHCSRFQKLDLFPSWVQSIQTVLLTRKLENLSAYNYHLFGCNNKTTFP